MAIWLGPTMIFLSYLGGYYFLALVLLMNGTSLWEFYSLFKRHHIHPYRYAGMLGSTLFLLLGYFSPELWRPLFILLMIFFLILHVNLKENGMSSRNSAFTIGGVGFITLFLSTLLSIRFNFETWLPVAAEGTSRAGGKFVIAMFGAVWICDTAAHWVGSRLGRHRLAPAISPKKTLEGALAGLFFGIIGFMILGSLLLPGVPGGYLLASGLIVGIFGQSGDLVESRFKRDVGAKDSSRLLPGHGGAFDRFDSIIFISPFLWMLLQYGKKFGLGG